MTVRLSPEYLKRLGDCIPSDSQFLESLWVGMYQIENGMRLLGITRMTAKEGDWLNKIKFELEAKGVKLPKEFWDEEIRLVQEDKPLWLCKEPDCKGH